MNKDNLAFIDIETTGLNPASCHITLFGLKLRGTYLILRNPSAKQLIDIYESLKTQGIKAVKHNGDTFDVPFMKYHKVSNAFVTYDTLIMSYLAGARWQSKKDNKETLDGKSGGSLSLKVLAKEFLGDWDVDVVKWNQLMHLLNIYKDPKNVTEPLRNAIYEGLKYYKIDHYILTYAILPVAQVQEELWLILEAYLRADLDGTEFVFNKYVVDLDAQDLKIHDYLMTLRAVYKVTSKRGLLVDQIKLDQLIASTGKLKDELQESVKHLLSNEIVNELDHCLDSFNLNSPNQLADILYKKMNLPIIAVSPKTGKPSTNKATLKRLAALNPAVARFLDYRDVKKEHEMLSKTLKTAVKPDGKIYPHISVVTTKTGRTSSYGPNIQQIKRGEMRSIFIAPKGYVIVEFDYSTAEMRVAAELSKDPVMMQAFKEGKDVHRLMAARILDKDESLITKEERQSAKAVNFGKLFGQGARGFKEYAFAQYDIDFSMKECNKIHKTFHDTYAALGPDYYDRVHAMAVANDGILYNLIGRKYYVGDKNFIPHVNPDGKVGIRGDIRNAAINYPVQSFANDMLLMSYAEAVSKLDNKDCLFFITVHDAIYAYIKDDPEVIKYYVKATKAIMEKPSLLKDYFDQELEVPMIADASLGYNMYEKKEYKDWLEELNKQ